MTTSAPPDLTSRTGDHPAAPRPGDPANAAPPDLTSRTGDPPWLRPAAWLARLVLAGVFLAAAAPKLLDPLGFADALAGYRVFPDVSLHVIATVVPALELVAALALLAGWRLRGALWLFAGMLIAFTVLLAVTLARGLDPGCGCFGEAAASDPVGPLHLLRNAGLLALVGLLFLVTRRAPVVDRPR